MYEDYVYFFKCLSHPLRIKLMKLLSRNKEISVTDLEEALPITHSSVSRHLNMLKMQGIVNTRREGQMKHYSLNMEKVQETFDDFIQLLT